MLFCTLSIFFEFINVPCVCRYFKLIEAEQRLKRHGFLTSRRDYFQEGLARGYIEDDHIPFLRRGINNIQ